MGQTEAHRMLDVQMFLKTNESAVALLRVSANAVLLTSDETQYAEFFLSGIAS